jgi:hypothetical protein
LMTAVVNRAESIGKEVKPLIIPTNNPLFAVVNTAKILGAQELIMGASNTYTADEQLEQIGFYWIQVCEREMEPLTVRILSRQRDVYLDLAGGNRIPKISERQARSVEELRSAGVGVSHALLVHSGTAEGSDLFKAVITMLDSQVALSMVALPEKEPHNGEAPWPEQDLERAKQLRRQVDIVPLPNGDPARAIVQLAQEGGFNLVIVSAASENDTSDQPRLDTRYILDHAPCWVCLVAPTAVPQELDEEEKPGTPPKNGST